jgi:hypothetical protein
MKKLFCINIIEVLEKNIFTGLNGGINNKIIKHRIKHTTKQKSRGKKVWLL